MAASQINTECKRYGCIKNLLACYANCKYKTRCDDLKTEIADKMDQAASDINRYLAERGAVPVTIQTLKRGLKFTESLAGRAAQKRASGKQQIFVAGKEAKKPQRAALTPLRPKIKTKSRKPIVTMKKAKREAGSSLSEKNQTVIPPLDGRETGAGETPSGRKKPARKKRSGNQSAASASRGVFIILEDKSAKLVDEKGLLRHLMSDPAPGARYFEAREVEARLQIVQKK